MSYEFNKLKLLDSIFDKKPNGIDGLLKAIPDENIIMIHKSYVEEYPDSIDELLTKPLRFLLNLKICKIVNRRECEYFYKENYLQLITALCIYNDKGILTLKTEPKMAYNVPTYSYIQGHVEYKKEYDDLFLADILNMNMIRERNEEVGCINEGKDLEYDFLSSKLIYTISSASSVKHICFCVPEMVDEEHIINFYSKEPEKHQIVFINYRDIISLYPNICPWVCESFNSFDFLQKNILQYIGV